MPLKRVKSSLDSGRFVLILPSISLYIKLGAGKWLQEASPVLYFCSCFKHKHNLYDIRKHKIKLEFVYEYLVYETDLSIQDRSACFLINWHFY